MLYSILAIGFGAALGAIMRWFLGLSLNALWPSIPPGTIFANLIGGYLIGVAVTFFSENPSLEPAWRLFVMTGFLGGLTTFSSFSAEVMALMMQGRFILASAAVGIHVLGSLLMTFLGILSVYALKSL